MSPTCVAQLLDCFSSLGETTLIDDEAKFLTLLRGFPLPPLFSVPGPFFLPRPETGGPRARPEVIRIAGSRAPRRLLTDGTGPSQFDDIPSSTTATAERTAHEAGYWSSLEAVPISLDVGTLSINIETRLIQPRQKLRLDPIAIAPLYDTNASAGNMSTSEPGLVNSGDATSRRLLQLQDSVSQPVVAAFCAGGVAGAVSRTVVSPLERLKILMQVQSVGRDAYKLSVGQALGKMWKEEGWRGFMRGNGTNCIRIVPYSAVQFSSYNFYKRNIFENYPGADLSPLSRLICGGIAGITSVFFTYPLDIVRTRLSIQSASFAELGERPQKLPGMWATLVHMYKTEGGMSALYRGIIPTVAGVAPYVGLNFMVYESVRKYLTPEGEQNPNATRKLLAGATSGAVAQTCTYPFDVLRRRFQINTMSGMGYQYKGITDAIRVIVMREGVKGLYKGIVPNLLKVAPSMASSWLSFEMTRDFLVNLRPDAEPHSL
ncbi:mitochondrial carrier [Fusarium albosuccineum]|uniref:Mitochondrial thiamine pyrophosphate carrier 1 n=1 Tax=Fusarium albosuccineum TaxID=1237068 RepID=A0A8H4P755_9HYPO|nr:mitochondrial carrier [Fusarium albosuccineum]